MTATVHNLDQQRAIRETRPLRFLTATDALAHAAGQLAAARSLTEGELLVPAEPIDAALADAQAVVAECQRLHTDYDRGMTR